MPGPRIATSMFGRVQTCRFKITEEDAIKAMAAKRGVPLAVVMRELVELWAAGGVKPLPCEINATKLKRHWEEQARKDRRSAAAG